MPINRSLPCSSAVIFIIMNKRTITALFIQKRNPNRVNIYLDGEFGFGLAKIVAAWLKVGDELDADKIEKLMQSDTFEVAYQKAIHFLGTRIRSIREVSSKLRDAGFEQPVIDQVTQRLSESRLLDDEQFAQTWVENRNSFRPRSHRFLAVELKQKGISDLIIQKTILSTEPEGEMAYKLAYQYARKKAMGNWQEFRKRLGAYLMRRGFGYDIVGPLIRKVWDEMAEDRVEIIKTINKDTNYANS